MERLTLSILLPTAADEVPILWAARLKLEPVRRFPPPAKQNCWPRSDSRLRSTRSSHRNSDAKARIGAKMKAGAGMEGPFRAPNAIGALSIQSTRAESKIRCPAVAFPRPGPPRSTRPISLWEMVTGRRSRTFIMGMHRAGPPSDRLPSCSPKMKHDE